MFARFVYCRFEDIVTSIKYRSVECLHPASSSWKSELLLRLKALLADPGTHDDGHDYDEDKWKSSEWMLLPIVRWWRSEDAGGGDDDDRDDEQSLQRHARPEPLAKAPRRHRPFGDVLVLGEAERPSRQPLTLLEVLDPLESEGLREPQPFVHNAGPRTCENWCEQRARHTHIRSYEVLMYV